MAQTKSKPKPRSQKAKAARSAKPKAPQAKPGGAKAGGAKAGGSSNGARPKKAASKAKLPLVAGSAAIAGAAGGLALATSKRARKSGIGKAIARRPKIKIDSGDVAEAAKQVGNFSAQVGELATELRRARESADGKRRSPVEVVLQGLTARR